MNRRQIVSAAVAAAVSLVLAGCGDKTPQELKVGATAGPHAAIVARVKRAVAQPSFVGALELDVTTSCGFAVSPADSLFPDDVRVIADRRMYEDKEATHRAQRQAALADEDAP